MATQRLHIRLSTALPVLACAMNAQPRYDLLLKGGHVIDPENGIDEAAQAAAHSFRGGVTWGA